MLQVKVPIASSVQYRNWHSRHSQRSLTYQSTHVPSMTYLPTQKGPKASVEVRTPFPSTTPRAIRSQSTLPRPPVSGNLYTLTTLHISVPDSARRTRIGPIRMANRHRYSFSIYIERTLVVDCTIDEVVRSQEMVLINGNTVAHKTKVYISQ